MNKKQLKKTVKELWRRDAKDIDKLIDQMFNVKSIAEAIEADTTPYRMPQNALVAIYQHSAQQRRPLNRTDSKLSGKMYSVI